jgi:hypothetical protein
MTGGFALRHDVWAGLDLDLGILEGGVRTGGQKSSWKSTTRRAGLKGVCVILKEFSRDVVILLIFRHAIYINSTI